MLIRPHLLLAVLYFSVSLHTMTPPAMTPPAMAPLGFILEENENGPIFVQDDGILSPEEANKFFAENDTNENYPTPQPCSKKVALPVCLDKNNNAEKPPLPSIPFFSREETVVRHLKLAHQLARREGWIQGTLEFYVCEHYQKAYSERYNEATDPISKQEAMALIAVLNTKLMLLCPSTRAEIFARRTPEPKKPIRNRKAPERLIEST